MNYSHNAIGVIAGEYVLGVAAPPLARAVRRRLVRDPRLAAAVRQWEADLHTLPIASHVNDAQADRVWQRIAATLPAAAELATPRAPTPPRSSPGRTEASGKGPGVVQWWRSLWVWQVWAVAASVAALWFGLGDRTAAPVVAEPSVAVAPSEPVVPPAIDLPAPAPVSADPAPDDEAATPQVASAATPAAPADTADDPPQAVAVAAAPADPTPMTRTTRGLSNDWAAAGPALVSVVSGTDSGGAAWLMRVDPDAGVVRVRVIAEQTATTDQDFELWAVPEGGSPQSLGLISGRDETVLPLDDARARAIAGAALFAVSVEPKGGSPAAGPTGPVRFAGPLVRI